MHGEGRGSEDLSGQRVGNLRIDHRLGKGGMGEVYEAWDERLQRRVALKVMRGAHRLDPASRSRFLREARVLSRLDDPGICRIHDLIERTDGDYLVLEHIEGATLASHLKAGPVERDRSLEIGEAVARVLAVAHGASVVHRDLKPENIMITAQGQVKILDFGLSRLLEPSGVAPTEHLAPAVPPDASLVDTLLETPAPITVASLRPASSEPAGTLDGLTELGSIVGTLRYMSPEQARGEAIKEGTDLYALGVILHELLAG